MHQTPYDILEVDETASPEVIDAAHRVLTQRYHPDAGTAPDAQRMTAVNEAYQTLQDPTRRAAIDAELRAARLTPAPPPMAVPASVAVSGYAPPPPMGSMPLAGGAPRVNSLAWISFLVAVLCFGPLGFVLALIARGQIRRSNGTETGMGWVIATFVWVGLQMAALAFFLLLVVASASSTTTTT